MSTTKQFITTILLSIMFITSGLFAFAGGTGTASDPWQITTFDHLNSVRNYLGTGHADKCFKIMNDIDASATISSTWIPTGNGSNYFYGNFDGNNFTISTLKCTYYGSYHGLFGVTGTGSIIKNVVMSNTCYILGDADTGSILGHNKGTVRNCRSAASVNIGNATVAGGIVGNNNAGRTSNCSFSGVITRSGGGVSCNSIGGIAGRNETGAVVDSCYSTGSITGNTWNGGLVGWNNGAINNCWTSGSINGAQNTNGGLVGQNQGTINNSYSKATVSGASYNGGLVGYMGSGSVTNCYATGLVTGGQKGGLCGYSVGTVSLSYWDKQTTGLTTSYGSVDTYGKTTAEMKIQATYEGWDFIEETANGTNDYWGINPASNSGYPFLKWQGYDHWLPFRFVTQSGSGIKDGSSWSNAYDHTQLQTAINRSPYQVWVAAGTYKPTTTSDMTISFIMKNDVAIYGGFSGTETELSQRNIGLNPTILSGDIGITGDNSDNSYHVIYNNQNGLNNTAIIDGFTISYGYANSGAYDSGAGIYLYESSPTILNCNIKDNKAPYFGGGVVVYYSYPTIINCQISNNNGGGISILGYSGSYTTVTVTNCTIVNNATGSFPDFIRGGIWNRMNNLVLNNCIIWGNSASYGKQIGTYEGSCIVNNSCFANGTGDVNVANGGTFTATNNNINTDPYFVNPAINDYRIYGYSPCTDTGDNSYNALTTDIRSFARKLNKADATAGTIDIGAYEYKYGTDQYESPTVFVTESGAGLKNGSSWSNAYDNTQLQTAINEGISQVWVAAGTYKPTTTTDRTIGFTMKNSLSIYGGFSGTETELSQRNIGANLTILSGDIGIAGNNSDNSYHVVYNNQNGLTNSAVLDGFTISYGYANGTYPHYDGAGIFLDESSPSIINCTIKSNSAPIGIGGGLVLYYSITPLTNCQITDNIGGGISIIGDSENYTNLVFTSCTIADNASGSANDRGGIWGRYINLNLNNCIIWGNTNPYPRKQISIGEGSCTLNYSCYSNGSGDIDAFNGGIFTAANNNITTDPLFADTANKDYRLLISSPCLDTGNDTFNTLTTDIRSYARKLNKTDGTAGTIDMGPFEYKFVPLTSPQNVTTVKNGTNLDITWTAVSGATGYKVYSCASPYGTFTEAATVTTNSWSVPITATKYFYYIKAYN